MTVGRVPVMLSEADVVSILHCVYETGLLERPSPNTMQKLRTALRRLNPDLDPDTLEVRDV